MRLKITIINFISLLLLIGCSGADNGNTNQGSLISNYDPKHDINKGAVVITNNGVMNIEQLHDFVEKSNKSVKSNLKIVKVTTEGDPIYHYLEFNGTEFIYKVDNTKDEYGDNNPKEIKCSKFTKINNKNKTTYVLQHCNNDKEKVVVLSMKESDQ
ncbi:protein of unknown function [Salinibacillus kushneri]|uniref:DUF4362 domain-containing protein n=1 Tax=Salinibacillus kushneri TaxID=237682 RepID=A0A1I0ESP5_9BACI|nr:DUF4362 domain-containing protein [Salinibacillus kushneri]SET48553.1 protein of unknown function [Salinibacillus kushneri]